MRYPSLAIVSFMLLVCCLYAVGQQPVSTFVPVTDEMLQNPDPADWLMWRRTLNSWGYSPLNQITRANVASLRQVWTKSMGSGIQEATPLVYRGVMYLPNPADDTVALNAATGEQLWQYKRPVPDDIAKWFNGAPYKSRNLAIY